MIFKKKKCKLDTEKKEEILREGIWSTTSYIGLESGPGYTISPESHAVWSMLAG